MISIRLLKHKITSLDYENITINFNNKINVLCGLDEFTRTNILNTIDSCCNIAIRADYSLIPTIIKGIERMGQSANTYAGIILINGIDNYQFPSYQELIDLFRETFPKSQIILSSNLPSILQCLNSKELIALGKGADGDIYVKDLYLSEYGLQGWTLQEILTDVLDVPSNSSILYNKTLDLYDQHMNEDDGKEILKQYHILMKMLHPANPLRKLLDLQVAEWMD